MAPRRWLLLSLAILSLVILVLSVMGMAFSAPLGSAAADAARLPADPEPHGGERVAALPIQDAAQVPTLLTGGNDSIVQRPGSLLVVADSSGDFAFSATNVSVVRALAYVAPDANGSYSPSPLVFHNLTRVDHGNLTTYNATVAVEPLVLGALGKPGFIVKADADSTFRFVPADHVVGQAALYVETGQVVWLLALSGLGFLGPIAWLIATHRPSGTKGLPGGIPGVTGLCPECRAPLAKSADFCTRCGAWVKDRSK